jgi:hypothetical protein
VDYPGPFLFEVMIMTVTPISDILTNFYFILLILFACLQSSTLRRPSLWACQALGRTSTGPSAPSSISSMSTSTDGSRLVN